MKILFTGGGTGGSVTPLIAIYQQLKNKEKKFDFFWIGGKNGIEKKIVSKYEIEYHAITSGKFRRYFSFKNFIDPFKIIAAFFQSIKILHKTKPNIIIAAGSYISVPVVWAGAFLKIPVLVHQQDIQIGLANKLMSRHAKKITVSLKDSLENFPKEKTVYTGNPVREEIFARQNFKNIKEKYKLEDLPTILFIGGGTGAKPISQAVINHLEDLLEFSNIFHITGKNKKIDVQNNIKNIHRYYQLDFVGKEIFAIMDFVDLIISRAGMSTLSELAVLGKPTIIIPMPNTHQEKNANVFYKNNAAVIVQQKYLNDNSFVKIILDLINKKPRLDNLSLNIKKMIPQDAAERVSEVVMDIIE
jgi:UDP-N-acetylglucosamine--N-acetylmuramyl-(pentapeptide) pyrophosphoryl-undecaprenol N-acetylglucosamine transferase